MQQQIITALVASKRHPERINIFVNGEFCVQVHLDLIGRYELRKNQQLTPELLEALQGDKRIMYVKQLALAYATYKARTEEQTRKRLHEKECSKEEIELAIDFLKEFAYLNDEEYARLFTRDYLLRKAVSAQKIRQELRKRGVDDSHIEQAIQQEFPHEQNQELALKAAEKKLRAVSYKPREKQISAVRDYLLRQGFRWEQIKEVLKKLFEEE